MVMSGFTRFTRGALTVSALLVALGAAPGAAAQAGLFAYPSAGQSEPLQRQDRFECHEWAVGQTGFDPNTAQAAAPQSGAYAAPPPAQSGFFGRRQAGQGGMVRDAAGGAALGAVAGTLFGGIRRGQRNRERAQYQQHQQAQAEQMQRQHQAVAHGPVDRHLVQLQLGVSAERIDGQRSERRHLLTMHLDRAV